MLSEDAYEATQAMNMLEARQMLNQMTATAYPKIKKEKRTSLWNRLYRRAYFLRERKGITVDEFIAMQKDNG